MGFGACLQLVSGPLAALVPPHACAAGVLSAPGCHGIGDQEVRRVPLLNLSVSVSPSPPPCLSYSRIEMSPCTILCLALRGSMPHPTVSLWLHGPGWGAMEGQEVPSSVMRTRLGGDLEFHGDTEEGLPAQPGVGWGEEGRRGRFPGGQES